MPAIKYSELWEFTIATAEKLGQNEEVVHEVIMWQFEELKRQVRTNVSVEVAGMGRFYIRFGMLRHQIRRLQKILNAYEKTAQTEMTDKLRKKIESAREELNFLIEKTKSYEFQTYMGGLEESSDTSEGDERTDTDGAEGEA